MATEIDFDDEDFDIEVYEKSVKQVEDTITCMQLYHYLSHLNFRTPLQETKDLGAIIVPYDMLRSVAYGFTENSEYFCILLPDVLYRYFKSFYPIKSMLMKDGDINGIAVMLKPLSYADYIFPPMQLFFPIYNKLTFDDVVAKSSFLCFGELEESFYQPNRYCVSNISNHCVTINSMGNYDKIGQASKGRRGIF